MRRWLYLSSYHWTALLLLMAVAALLVAWISLGLIDSAMANLDFIRHYGFLALADGGLRQALEIAGKAVAAFLSYLAFKGIETELISRWRSREGH